MPPPSIFHLGFAAVPFAEEACQAITSLPPDSSHQGLAQAAATAAGQGRETTHLLVQLYEIPSEDQKLELWRQGLDLSRLFSLADEAGGVTMDPIAGIHGATVWIPEAKLAKLAQSEDVLWIEEGAPPLTETNDGARANLRADAVIGAPYNLTGLGVRAFVFDGGTVRSTHETFNTGGPSRVTLIDNGNERSGGSPRGRCGASYVTTAPPSCAKNPIHIGALNSDGGSMTRFSSWGPCDDGRLKPVVSGPGCESGRVTGETALYSSTSTNDTSYGLSCGTSMSTPAVAGTVALFIQDWRAQTGAGATAPAAGADEDPARPLGA